MGERKRVDLHNDESVSLCWCCSISFPSLPVYHGSNRGHLNLNVLHIKREMENGKIDSGAERMSLVELPSWAEFNWEGGEDSIRSHYIIHSCEPLLQFPFWGKFPKFSYLQKIFLLSGKSWNEQDWRQTINFNPAPLPGSRSSMTPATPSITSSNIPVRELIIQRTAAKLKSKSPSRSPQPISYHQSSPLQIPHFSKNSLARHHEGSATTMRDMIAQRDRQNLAERQHQSLHALNSLKRERQPSPSEERAMERERKRRSPGESSSVDGGTIKWKTQPFSFEIWHPFKPASVEIETRQ